jgi:hypothetical protein
MKMKVTESRQKASIRLLRGADIALAVALVLLGFLVPGHALTAAENGGMSGGEVRIERNGQRLGAYDLSQDRTIPLKNGVEYNLIEIRDGSVRMADANCRGRDCVHQGVKRAPGQMIVCLPHGIVVTIERAETTEGGDHADAYTH